VVIVTQLIALGFGGKGEEKEIRPYYFFLDLRQGAGENKLLKKERFETNFFFQIVPKQHTQSPQVLLDFYLPVILQ
jgi:hypothetical protein